MIFQRCLLHFVFVSYHEISVLILIAVYFELEKTGRGEEKRGGERVKDEANRNFRNSISMNYEEETENNLCHVK